MRPFANVIKKVTKKLGFQKSKTVTTQHPIVHE